MEAISQERQAVIDFIDKEWAYTNDPNVIIVYCGVGARVIKKYIAHPEKCGNWPFDFVCLVERSVKKLLKHYIIPHPALEEQTEEDRVLSRLLRKNSYLCFGTNLFFKSKVKVEHVILYMERSEEIKNWTTCFLLSVIEETKRTKDFLL